jgi:probable phosphoglycerate mutase
VLAGQNIRSKGSEVSFLVTMPELQEQDFGLLEGAPYGDYLVGKKDELRDTAETQESMVARARLFIAESLIPLLIAKPNAVVAVVSHGNMLHVLWPQILAGLKPVNVVSDQKMVVESGSIDHVMLGPWNNTGYFEANIRPVEAAAPAVVPAPLTNSLPKHSVEIHAINCTAHLVNLHRTRGGVGSSKYDSKQTSIDSFFKRG